MEIRTRAFQREDLAACLQIEAAAVPSNHYFKDVLDYFATTKGELTLGLVDGQIAGFGKLTVLFDGSAWLELLRVDPRFQRKGVGAHIYQRYLAQLKEMNCPAVAMYTGVRNVASAALAEKNGLRRGQEFRGMSLDVTAAPDPAPASLALVPDKERAARLLEPLKEQCGGRLSINHTFYRMNPQTYGGFASNGWVFESPDSLLVMGARFQPAKALYIAALAGDKQQALNYAVAQAKSRGIPKITAHFPPSDSAMEAFYRQNGFTRDPSDDVVMETER